MSWGGATSFTLSGGTYAGETFTLDPNQTTSSIVVFERQGYTNYGVTFALESGATVLYTTYPGSDDTAFPNRVKTSTYATIAVSYPVVATDTVTFTTNSGGTTLGSFQMSSAFLWGSGSGGGPNPLSTFVSGSIVDNSTHYTFTVNSTAPSSSGVVAYNVLKDDVLYGTITHTNGSTNPMDVYLTSRSTSVWKLTIVSSTGLYNSGVLAIFNQAQKKVFCNFW